MWIKKIFNNNVVLTEDPQKNEIIVMGKGLAFCKKVGDEIDSEKIDKTYRLENDKIFAQFQELLQDLPLEYLSIADEMIEFGKEVLGTELNESIYISLTDHIHMAIERVKGGIEVRNVLLWDIRRFFPKEYQVGKKSIQKIEEFYHVKLPEDEAGFIALHFVNAQTENDEMNDMYELTIIMQDIINIVKYYFHIDLDEDSVYFYRFTTHLRFFVSRMMRHAPHEGETDEELLLMIKKKYHNGYQCVEKIALFLRESHDYEMTADEKLYLTIHVARLVQKNNV